jgi:RNA polymerase sigma-70 factor (ECF subfamily)
MALHAAGDPRAFDELYRRISPELFRYLKRLTGDPWQAEDLLQITFAKAHAARQRYLPGAPILPWARAIARNAFIDEVRAARRGCERLSPDGRLPELALSDSEDRELAEILRNALARLKPQQREAIELTRLSGLSLAEAAERLGISTVALKLRVHRGYQCLRRELCALTPARPFRSFRAQHEARQSAPPRRTA